MKLATFNIYWLGDDSRVERDEGDNERLAEVVAQVGADVFVFQEIVDPDVLREILDRADEMTGRQYVMHDAQNHLLGDAHQSGQKVVMAYDAGRYELLAASPIRGGVGRLPFGLRLQSKGGSRAFTVVGVHFKSGQPEVPDEKSSDKRQAQCQHLADWAAGKLNHLNAGFPGPAADEHVAVLGDFNAVYDAADADHPLIKDRGDVPRFLASLDPLRRGHMAEWLWEKPVEQSPGDGRVSNYEEKLLIDFIMLSPSLRGRVLTPPTLYAFDRMGASGKRVSDHRPVYAEVDV